MRIVHSRHNVSRQFRTGKIFFDFVFYLVLAASMSNPFDRKPPRANGRPKSILRPLRLHILRLHALTVAVTGIAMGAGGWRHHRSGANCFLTGHNVWTKPLENALSYTMPVHERQQKRCLNLFDPLAWNALYENVNVAATLTAATMCIRKSDEWPFRWLTKEDAMPPAEDAMLTIIHSSIRATLGDVAALDAITSHLPNLEMHKCRYDSYEAINMLLTVDEQTLLSEVNPFGVPEKLPPPEKGVAPECVATYFHGILAMIALLPTRNPRTAALHSRVWYLIRKAGTICMRLLRPELTATQLQRMAEGSNLPICICQLLLHYLDPPGRLILALRCKQDA
jgi:hypothetical protein